jgi:hypothetical protein
MEKRKTNLTIGFEGDPECFQTVGIPPKAGDTFGGVRVRTVFGCPGEPDYQIVILEARLR